MSVQCTAVLIGPAFSGMCLLSHHVSTVSSCTYWSSILRYVSLVVTIAVQCTAVLIGQTCFVGLFKFTSFASSLIIFVLYIMLNVRTEYLT